MRFVPARLLGQRADKSKESIPNETPKTPGKTFSSFFKSRTSPSKEKSHGSEHFYPIFNVTLFLPSIVCNGSASTAVVSDHTHLHTALYVQTNSLDTTGYIHHVTGTISLPAGLAYTWQPFTLPDPSQGTASTNASSPIRGNEELGDFTLVTREWVGYTAKEGYPENWETLLRREVPVPGWQVNLNPGTGKYQRIRQLGTGQDGIPTQVVEWWEEGEGPELVGCKEWVEMGAIPVLESRGLLIKSVM